jgi:hypothetical protein
MPLRQLMGERLFKSIISELEAIEQRLAAREDLAPERARIAAVRACLDTAARTGRLERVVAALLPVDVPPLSEVWHAHRTAEARLECLREHGAWTASELAQRAGSRATNRSALASAWRAAGRIVGVDWHGTTVFPVFQFDAHAQPRAAIAPVLAQLRAAGLDEWEQALWFTTRTGWLDDRRPLDVLDEEPAAVVVAAAAFHDRPT